MLDPQMNRFSPNVKHRCQRLSDADMGRNKTTSLEAEIWPGVEAGGMY